MGKAIVFVHGRDFKPEVKALRKLWYEAVEWSLQRDHPAKLNAFRKAKKEFVYYGDLSAAFLRSKGKKYNEAADIVSRNETLTLLKQYRAGQFSRSTYKKLPGRKPWMEALADLFGGVTNLLKLSDDIIAKVAPDMEHYWSEGRWGSDVRERMIAPLSRALNGHKTMVIAHSLGTMIAYDTFWKFSRMSEYRDRFGERKKIDLFLSLGSPLADETVKKRLKGASSPDADWRYPANINRWVNVAAEDDFISHDGKVRNDFRDMLKLKLVKSIKDVHIYNLALRHGGSNPHHGPGYLIHPNVTKVIADWL